MLKVFKEKSELFKCPTVILKQDLVHEKLNQNIMYNGIVSSMTMHHIENQEDMFFKMYALLTKDGFIALADLDSEDGTFHSNNEGVFHFGFKRDFLKTIAKKVGFKEINFYAVNSIEKSQGTYKVFLMTANK